MTTLRPPYPELRGPVQDSLLAADGSDNSARMAALLSTLPSIGGEIPVLPGRYRFYSEVDISDIPSVKVKALSGKHYQGTGTTVSPNTAGGVIFEGWTPGQTLFKCQRPSNPDATHQGPTFEGIGFQDGRSVASRQTIDAVALVSGTTYRYTTRAAHPFVASDPVFINGVWGQGPDGLSFGAGGATGPYGTAFNGHFTVSNVPDTTHFDVNIGSNPSLTGLVYSSADVRYAPSMTLLAIEHQTRARLRDCHFHGGLVGLRMGENSPTGNDVSWANFYGNSFNLNDTGILFTGNQAQSIAIQGGDFQIANGQIGMDVAGSRAMFRARDFKMDTIYNDGIGVYGIRLQGTSNYDIDGSFELDGPATGILAGTTGNSYGRIHGTMQGSNAGSRGARVGTAIQITGTEAGTTGSTSDVGEVSLTGATFNGFGTAVTLDANTRGVKVIGGSTAFCDVGVDATGSQGAIVAFFTHRRSESGYQHIISGVDTKRIFCDDVNASGGIVPGAGSTNMTTGFVHISSGAGPPTGTPTSYTGVVPLYFDTAASRLYIYNGSWLKTVALT